jgi:hypothetical protein
MANETLTVNRAATFKVLKCIGCGVEFAMPEALNAERVRDKQNFYCPNGHEQHFTGKSDAMLRREAEQAAREAQALAEARQRELDGALRTIAKVKKEAKAAAERVEHRVESGVCLHCHRTFKNVARHMYRQHDVANGAEAVDKLAAK